MKQSTKGTEALAKDNDGGGCMMRSASAIEGWAEREASGTDSSRGVLVTVIYYPVSEAKAVETDVEVLAEMVNSDP
jgi:hypothetical protein